MKSLIEYLNMRKFKEGDNLTLEDVKQAMNEAKIAGRVMINENAGVKPEIKNGVAFFNSIEDAEKYYGGTIMSLEEAFK